ncbi:MAG: L-lactate permease [Anaerolineae bacterium]|jgi:lactate permease
MNADVLWASAPLVIVLGLMLWRRWSSARAGATGLAAAVLIAALRFGLTWDVLWVSQARGVALSFYILYIIWAALLLYQVVRAAGGIGQLESWLLGMVADQPAAALLFSWCLSGVLEGIAGFGVPLAVVAPMLVALGIGPVTAVAAVAIGHAWSVTFGDMGVVFEALVSVVGVPRQDLVPAAAASLGVACVASGWAVSRLVGLRGRAVQVGLIGLAMAGTQGVLALVGLAPLAALGGGAAGLVVGVVLLGRGKRAREVRSAEVAIRLSPYLVATAVLALPAFSPSVATALAHPSTQVSLPAVSTSAGWVTAAGGTKAIPWLLHPATAMLAALGIVVPFYIKARHTTPPALGDAIRRTVRAAIPTSAGVAVMIALAMVMDHTGMVQVMAQAASQALGAAFPAVSGLVGLLGAFTTGSNTSSNVLFGPLQESMATLLGLAAPWLLAAQTAGGAVGSMVAPAKLVVGCSSVGVAGAEGEVMRRTAPLALGVAVLVGLVALALA